MKYYLVHKNSSKIIILGCLRYFRTPFGAILALAKDFSLIISQQKIRVSKKINIAIEYKVRMLVTILVVVTLFLLIARLIYLII